MEIRVDNLGGQEIAEFLEDHIRDMKSVSPPESKHALDLQGLRSKSITFWTLRTEGKLVGCAALKELDRQNGEIKSMRISPRQRGKGIGGALLTHILDEATKRGYQWVKLETGSMPFFEPARSLYRKFGFEECEPFADYKVDPNSVFMRLRIS